MIARWLPKTRPSTKSGVVLFESFTFMRLILLNWRSQSELACGKGSTFLANKGSKERILSPPQFFKFASLNQNSLGSKVLIILSGIKEQKSTLNDEFGVVVKPSQYC